MAKPEELAGIRALQRRTFTERPVGSPEFVVRLEPRPLGAAPRPAHSLRMRARHLAIIHFVPYLSVPEVPVSAETASGVVADTGGRPIGREQSAFILFFLFSGMHGIHIIVGLAGLFALLYRTREPASGPRWRMNTRVLANAVALFWHYLDGLWIVLFAPLLFVKR